MANSPDIDNDEVLFLFDPFDSRQSLSYPGELAAHSENTMSSSDVVPTSEELAMDIDIEGGPSYGSDPKGKAKSIPMAIRPSPMVHDNFEFAPANLPSPSSFAAYRSSSLGMAFSPSTSNFSSDFGSLFDNKRLSMESTGDLTCPIIETSCSTSYPGKGKLREDFPMLPPLNFTAMDLDCNPELPPSSGLSPYGDLAGSPDISAYSLSCSPETAAFVFRPPAIRCRSLTNLSQRPSPLTASAPTTITFQSSFGSSNSPSNISRQLQGILDHKENQGPHNQPSTPALEPATFLSISDLHAIQKEPGSCPPAWYTVAKPNDHGDLLPTPSRTLRHKARSQSSPFPTSVLDFVPVTATDVFEPLPVATVNYFDLVLPKELRLQIFCFLVEIHAEEHQRWIDEGRMTFAKAASSRSRWVGRDRGIRELFKLSRVSKSWQALVIDGQLWSTLDLRSFSGLPQSVVARVVNSAGPFIRTLNIAGHTHLLPNTITSMANDLCLVFPDIPLSYTQLTEINLQGCTSITTRSLHHLLVRCKFLKALSVKGLSAATNTTCDIIGNFCRHLERLNMSRCPNMDAEGIKGLAFAANLRQEHLVLKELRLSGLKLVTDPMMRELGKAAPYLEILDMSYSRQLHNSAVEAFVACPRYMDTRHDFGVDTIEVLARDLGREGNDMGKMKRRVTRLRHLALSSCVMLTDTACSNLTFSVPKLEFLELGGIGPDLKEEGLIRLLQQTPRLRRLDLEDASDITDAVLRTITPSVDPTNPSPALQPGSLLEHLIISQAPHVSEETILFLIRNCSRLRVLEADNTLMNKTSLKEFVKLSQERKLVDPKLVAIDCRGVNEATVKEVSSVTRPRFGWRRYDARKLYYLDARDGNEDELKVGQDECDPNRVVLKSFYSWQTVDAVKTAREKRRKSSGRRMGSDSSVGMDELEGIDVGGRRPSTRWWSPGGRRPRRSNSGSVSPLLADLQADGCLLM